MTKQRFEHSIIGLLRLDSSLFIRHSSFPQFIPQLPGTFPQPHMPLCWWPPADCVPLPLTLPETANTLIFRLVFFDPHVGQGTSASAWLMDLARWSKFFWQALHWYS
jgi:hypothetical protein